MSFFHKKKVTKCLGHHYAIWTSDSNFLLAQKNCSGRPKAGPHFKHCFPPFFLFLAWRPYWLEVGITGHNFGRGPSKDHSTKVWLQLAQWFLRRRLKCEMLTDGQRTTDDRRRTKRPGELERRG